MDPPAESTEVYAYRGFTNVACDDLFVLVETNKSKFLSLPHAAVFREPYRANVGPSLGPLTGRSSNERFSGEFMPYRHHRFLLDAESVGQGIVQRGAVWVSAGGLEKAECGVSQ